MEKGKAEELLNLINDHLGSEKEGFKKAVDLATSFAEENLIPPDYLLERCYFYFTNKSYSLAYVFGKTYAHLSTRNTDTANALLITGLSAAALGQKEEAEEQYKLSEKCFLLSIKTDPNDASILSDYGLLLEKMGRKDEAEKQYKRALEIDPNNAHVLSDYGYLLVKTGNMDEAEKQYKHALKIDPSNASILSDYGYLLVKMGRMDEAEKQYTYALEIDPNNADILSDHGHLLVKMGRMDEAEKQYKRALEIDPNNAATYSNYGFLLVEMGRMDEAEKQYKCALEIDPNNAATCTDYGILLVELGRKGEAEKQYQLALENDPNNPVILYNYGNLLQEMGLHEEAEKQYTHALEIDPNNAVIHLNYGDTLVEVGRTEDAKIQYTYALEIDPNNAAIIYNYGNLLQEMGLHEEAEKQYKLVLNIQTEDWRNLLYKAYILEKIGNTEDAINIFDSIVSNQNKIKNKKIVTEARFKKEVLKKQNDEAEVLNKVLTAFKEKRDNLFDNINEIESTFKKFVDSERSIPKDFFSFLSVLRRWNSYTPILPSEKGDNKGGGYFLYHRGKGIVIDPGFNFIENFYKEGFKVADIDAVLITHAHNDHTADLESILTLIYKHNHAIKDSVKEENKDNRQYKKIDLFMNVGAFMKYSGWLNIRDSNEINSVTVLMPNAIYNLPSEEYHGIKIYTTKAKHDEIISNKYPIGFILDIEGINKIGFTGDTGWDRDEIMVDPFRRHKPKLVIAHLGSIKKREFDYVNATCDDEKNNCFYRHHLGLLGMTKFLDVTRPELTIVSEFGEELGEKREDIVNVIGEVLDLNCLPGDIGLHIKLSDLSVYCFIEEDFVDHKSIETDFDILEKGSPLCFHKRQASHKIINGALSKKPRSIISIPLAQRIKSYTLSIE